LHTRYGIGTNGRKSAQGLLSEEILVNKKLNTGGGSGVHDGLFRRSCTMKYVIALMGFVLTALQVQAQDGYRIQPGDVLRVEVLEDQTLNRDALVLPDGSVSLPLAGTIRAGGRDIGTVQSEIASQLAPNFATPPTVFVSVAQLSPPPPPAVAGAVTAATVSVFLLGEAAVPGKLEVEPGTTVLQALAQAGGVTNFAATKRLQLRRDGKIYQLNYKALESGGSGFDSAVADGDVIFIPQRRLFE
jgi:polysaccharide export outer membrane protein